MGGCPTHSFDAETLVSTIQGKTPIIVTEGGASAFGDVNQAPLAGHYHTLPAGTPLPNGLGLIADGSDIYQSSRRGPTHHTIYPTRDMSFDEFSRLYQSLPWQYGGKIKG